MDSIFPELTYDEAKMTSPLALAYIGDAVYELFVRAHVMQKGNMPVNKLHRASTHHVSARAQSSAAHRLSELLTEEELSVYKRGRNAHSYTSAKNADIVDYRHATGFEALLGYLFLMKRDERLKQLMELAVSFGEDNCE